MRVFFLEDEAYLSELYIKAMEKKGWKVTHTETIQGMKELILKESADILILDYGIHDDKKTGIDVLRFAREYLPQAKIFMLTNYSHVRIREKIGKDDIDEIFMKTMTPPDLLPVRIEQILGKKERED